MNEVFESIQPQLSAILVAIIGVFVTLVLALVARLQKRLILWIDSKTSVSDRELIYKVAGEAFALAEKSFKTSTGQAKLNFAYSYASELLIKAGIKITNDEIKAAIEKSVLEYNVKSKKSS